MEPCAVPHPLAVFSRRSEGSSSYGELLPSLWPQVPLAIGAQGTVKSVLVMWPTRRNVLLAGVV